jgi:dihydropteroate synthase
MDPEIAHIAAKNDARLILMHMKGIPKNMQLSPNYTDLFEEILSFLEKAVTSAVEKGVARSKIIIDPGIGFGKTIQHNLLILKDIERFKALGLPVLIGLSRKAFIRKIVKPPHMEDIDPLLPVVETGTQAAVATTVMNGVDIVRVHDVAATYATIKVISAITNGEH